MKKTIGSHQDVSTDVEARLPPVADQSTEAKAKTVYDRYLKKAGNILAYLGR